MNLDLRSVVSLQQSRSRAPVLDLDQFACPRMRIAALFGCRKAHSFQCFGYRQESYILASGMTQKAVRNVAESALLRQEAFAAGGSFGW
jgi:hypothetical protein